MAYLTFTPIIIGFFILFRESSRYLVSKWLTALFCLTLLGGSHQAQGLEGKELSAKQKPASHREALKARAKKGPHSLPQIMSLGSELYSLGEYQSVAALVWGSIENADREAIMLLIRAQQNLKEYDQILKATQILISKNKADAEVLTIEGRAFLDKAKSLPPSEGKRLKLPSQGLESLKKAIEADPKYLPAYEEVIKLYDVKERPNFYELRLIYQDMIEAIGPRFEFYSKLCKINFLDGVNEPALIACNKAIQLNPKNPDSYIYLGLVHRQIGELEKGMKELKEATQKFSNVVFAFETYAKALLDDKNFIEAFRYYETCIGLDKTSESCLVGAGLAGAEIQKFEKSLEYLQSACQLSRKHSTEVRRAASQVKTSKADEWLSKYERLARSCRGGP